MMLRQIKTKQYCFRRTIFGASSAIGFYCLFFAVLPLSGCTAPQPQVKSAQEVAPPEAKAIPQSVPTREAKAAPMPEEKTMAAVSDDKIIYFPLRVATVDEAGKEKLRRHAEYLKQNPKTVVTLVGYIDDLGSRNYNLAITEQRILTVRKLLRTYGVSTAQIRRNSGKTPVTCTSTDCRQKMRRVELVYSP